MTEDLYHAAILEAARRGAENRRLAQPDRSATIDNPLCGDRVTIDLRIEGGIVAEIGFRARGCALCQASTALLADAAVGHVIEAVTVAEAAVRAILVDGAEGPGEPWAGFGVFAPACRFPSRHACVLIAFEAFDTAARGGNGV